MFSLARKPNDIRNKVLKSLKYNRSLYECPVKELNDFNLSLNEYSYTDMQFNRKEMQINQE